MISPRNIRKRRETKEDEFLYHLKDMGISDDDLKQVREQIYIITNSKSVFNMDLRKYVSDVK